MTGVKGCTAVVLFVSAVLTSPASAYELTPQRAARWLGKQPVHEALTLASLECANAFAGGDVADLRCGNRSLEKFKIDYEMGRWRSNQEARELVDGVRWPDDPLRVATKPHTAVELKKVFNLCESYLEGEKASCTNRFCQSHFGNLQMLHAMKPKAAWCGDAAQEKWSTCTVRTTYAWIKAWSTWLAEIAMGAVPGEGQLFKDPAGFPGTVFQKDVCGKTYRDDMTVGQLFGTRCFSWLNLRQVTLCKVSEPTAGALRRLALGALLHLVQDSFSNAHVDRSPTTPYRCPEPIISCKKVSAFRSYTDQDPDVHAQSDKWPRWDASCDGASREIDDPITAGAKLILMARQNSGKPLEFWTFLRDRVFGLAEPSVLQDGRAGDEKTAQQREPHATNGRGPLSARHSADPEPAASCYNIKR